MNCKSALSTLKSPFSVPNNSIKCHESSISFASQISKSRISIPIGPCRARPAAQIKAHYAPRGIVESPYEVLGIEESGSTLSDIKKAYKKMARKYHPDVSPPERVDEHTRKFIMVKEAYEMLSDPQRTALYDRNLTNRHNQRSEVTMEEWKMRWQSQLDELKRRSKNSSRTGRMSWGARMRARSGV